MSGGKSEQKANFSAIYKLEFYKNKKNWKFGHEEKSCIPESDPKNKQFNVTYNLNAVSDEKLSPLNDGFVADELELNQSLQSVKETEVLADTLDWGVEEQDNIIAEDDTYMWMHQENEDQAWQQYHQDADGLDWWNNPGEDAYNGHGGGENGRGWRGVPVATFPQCPQGRGDILQQALPWADAYYLPEDFECDALENREVSSADSYTDFSRGAHFAPHSSEVELLQDTMERQEPGRALDAASSAELCALTAAHASALSALFAEIMRRNAQHEFPNHTACHHQRAHGWPAPALLCPVPEGRGRGRLRSGIRIGMGRPYRFLN